MTTSDDGPRYPDDDSALADTTHADPLDGYTDDSAELAPVAPVAPRPGIGRLLLAILLSLVVAAAGIAAWSVIYVEAEREYVGVSVVIGLIVGYVVRLVSGRNTIPARLIAVLITALTCVVGTVAAEAAFTANTYGIGFMKVFQDILPDALELMSRRPALTLAIFAAALVLAFMSASPQEPKKKKRAPADDDEPPVSPVMPLDDADHVNRDDDGGDGNPPPPQIAAG